MDMSPTIERLRTEIWRTEDIAPIERAAEPGFAPYAAIHRGDAVQIVPLHVNRAAAAAMLRWTDAMGATEVAARIAAWSVLRSGLTERFATETMSVRVSGSHAEPSLHDVLADLFGLENVDLTVALGRPRPNQKPIVRVFGPSGRTVGFVKVGWSELTTSLVATETSFLSAAHRSRAPLLTLPVVVGSTTWRDRLLSATQPVLGRPPLGKPPPPAAAVYGNVLALGDRRRVAWATCDLRQRMLQGKKTLANPERIQRLVAHLDDNHAGMPLLVGRWHGDWTPWNLRTIGSKFIVWDWERTTEGMPVGFDTLHHGFSPRFAATPSGELAPLLETLRTAVPVLLTLGVPTATHVPVMAMYAATLHMRFGVDPGDPLAAATGALLDAATEFLMRGSDVPGR